MTSRLNLHLQEREHAIFWLEINELDEHHGPDASDRWK